MTKSDNIAILQDVIQKKNAGLSDAFILKFDKNCNLLWSSYFGGEDDDEANGIGVDKNLNILFTGRTFSKNFPVTEDAVQDTITDSNDSFVAKITPDGKEIIWSSYYGGHGNEWGWGITADDKLSVYAAGDTESLDFHTSEHPIQSENRGFIDAYILKLCATIPKPIVTVKGKLNFCEGDSVTLEANDGFFKYRWSNGIEKRAITIKNSGEYWVTVWDTNYCDASSKTFNITSNPLPIVKITGENNICVGDSTILDAGKFAKYIWSTSDTTRTIVVKKSGRYTVNIIDSNGCNGSAFFDVGVYPRPHPIILGPKIVCSNSKGNLYYVDNLTGSTFEWNIIGAKNFTGQGSYRINVDWDTAGTGIIEVTETINNSKCSASDTIEVTILKAEQPQISSSTGKLYLCSGDSLILDAGYGFSNYKWSNNSTAQTLKVKQPGIYHVIVKDLNGCSGYDTVEVKLYDNPNPKITGELNLCESDELFIYQTQFFENHFYEWKVSGGEIIEDTDSNLIKVKWNKAGSGKIELIETIDSTDCFGVAEPITINIYPIPQPKINYRDKLKICEGDSVILDAGDGYKTYEWSIGADSQEIIVKNSGVYSVTVKNEFDCQGADSVIVEVFPLPDKPDITQSNDTLFAPAGYTYIWYLDKNEVESETKEFIIPQQTGNYSVKVINSNGCYALSDEVYVWVGVADAIFSLGDTIYANTGDLVKVYIELKESRNLDILNAFDYSIFLRYNRSILLPNKIYNHLDYQDYNRVITLEGRRKFDKGILDSIEFFVALGNDKCSFLEIDSVVWKDALVKNLYINSAVCIINLCNAGGIRYFNPETQIFLDQNRPNPFTEKTEIEFGVLENAFTRLFVSDVMGRKVKTLYEGIAKPGSYIIEFTADELTNGPYFYILQTPSYSLTKRMEILK